ncbi:MAG: AAA family ATPase [Armatimonadetes bacterium]|nr:AAA family ATPase [Armatimonadota bacterium]
MSRPLDRVLSACAGLGLSVKTVAGWNRCPNPCSPEGDNRLSFAFKESAEGVVFVRSHKPSHTAEDCLRALGLSWGDCFPEKDPRNLGKWQGRKIVHGYEYVDQAGRPVGRVARTDHKDFPQGTYDRQGNYVPGLAGGHLPLYLAPQVRQAVDEGATIFVTEGEKDALSLFRAGFPATTKPGGAGSTWHEDHVALLAGASIVVVADRDEAGEKAAADAYRALVGVARSVRIVQAKSGKDATDHLVAGHSVDEFLDRQDLAPRAELKTSTGRAVTSIDVSDVEDCVPPCGVMTGFSSLDRGTESAGLPKGQMTVLAARKKVGKTSAMTQLAATACNGGNRVLYVTLADLTPAQIWRRMRRQQTGSADAPYNLETAQAWHEKVAAMRSFWELRFADAGMLGGRYVEQIVPAIDALHGAHSFDLVVIDYAQKLKSSSEHDRVRAMELTSSELAYMAARHGFALLVASQTAEDGRTRYSQEFEDDCGLLIRLTAPDGLDCQVREMEVPFNRFGPPFKFFATWNRTHLTIHENEQ